MLSCELAAYFRNTFYKNTNGGLLLNITCVLNSFLLGSLLLCKLLNAFVEKIEVARTKKSLHNVNCSQCKHELNEKYTRYSHVVLDLNFMSLV